MAECRSYVIFTVDTLSMAKPKLKTDPIAVRFNVESFNLVKEKENLQTPQQVVNFLLDNYRNVKVNPMPLVLDAPPVKTPNDEPPQMEPANKEEIQKQIDEIRKEVKPSMIANKAWDINKQKRINELYKQLK